MTHLIQIGNSQGIRIPKLIIKQAKLSKTELELKIVDEGLLVKPSQNPRHDWREKIDHILSEKGQEPIDKIWLETDLNTNDIDWEW